MVLYFSWTYPRWWVKGIGKKSKVHNVFVSPPKKKMFRVNINMKNSTIGSNFAIETHAYHFSVLLRHQCC